MVRLTLPLVALLAISSPVNSAFLNKRLEPAVTGAIIGGSVALAGAGAAAATSIYNSRRREKHEKDIEAQKQKNAIELEDLKLKNKKAELQKQTEYAAKLERAKKREDGKLSPFSSPSSSPPGSPKASPPPSRKGSVSAGPSNSAPAKTKRRFLQWLRF